MAAVTAALWAAAVGLVTLGVVVTIVWAVSARGGEAVRPKILSLWERGRPTGDGEGMP